MADEQGVQLWVERQRKRLEFGAKMEMVAKMIEFSEE